MVSDAQLKANAANAKQGGVKTEAGKAAVRLNAVKHGLTSKEVLLRSENKKDLDTLRQDIMSDLQPQGGLEKELVDWIITDIWRLRRAIRLETEYLQNTIDWRTDGVLNATLEQLARLEVSMMWAPWKTAIDRDMTEGGALSKLERYRTSIERHLYRSLQELRTLQADRRHRQC